VVRHSPLPRDGKKLRRFDLKAIELQTMSPPLISVENLSKRYLVGHREERGGHHSYIQLREVIGREMRNVARKAVDVMRGRQVVQGDAVEEFWALKDISFELQEGEVLGIIGRNGAGKSTLLKVLSRITEPTTGRITLRGRVASLLEVGTGFHPELSGRENIYLNGAILGMTRAEIRKKFDEIVAFAEVERFLDTPVKRYSSGMYVRLAFAVAAHLEPEILVVDEVLAVGDSEFQSKCLGKMGEVSRAGRTVLLVSHNMSSIAALADRALLLDHGSVAVDGLVSDAVSAYISHGPRQANYVLPPGKRVFSPHVSQIEVVTSEGSGLHHFGEPLEIRFSICHQQPLERGCFSFQIINGQQQPVIHAGIFYPQPRFGHSPGCSILTCRFPRLQLNVGQFYLRTFLSEPPGGAMYETLDSVAHFEMIRSDPASPWGWRADACTYHEEHSWDTVDVAAAAVV
jgi:ABC-type polysaccharide/polyol phosphate transport system ATPase subunit